MVVRELLYKQMQRSSPDHKLRTANIFCENIVQWGSELYS